MDKLNSIIGSSSYAIVPIAAFAAILLIAAFIGWINGWKASLYFFGWNVVGVITGVLLSTPIINGLSSNKNIKPIISAAENLVGIMILFIYMIVINLLAFIFYWFFRKKLKRSIKNNKKAGISNVFGRFVGLGISAASSLPTAVFISDSGAILSHKNSFTNFLDTMTKGLTGGKYDGTDEARVLIKNISHIANFAQLISNGDISDLDTKEAKEALQDVLNTDFANNVGEIYDSLSGSSFAKDNDFKKEDLNSVEARDIYDASDDEKNNTLDITISAERHKQLHASLMKMFSDNPNPEEVVGAIFMKLFGQ